MRYIWQLEVLASSVAPEASRGDHCNFNHLYKRRKLYVLALWKGLLSFLARCLFLLAHLGEIGLIQTFTSIVDEDFIYHSEVLNSGVQNVLSVDIGIQEAMQVKST